MKIENFTYFFPEKPKLISKDQPLFKRLSDDPDWIAELKYNGSRLQLHNFDGKFEFWDRHHSKLNYQPSDWMMDNLNHSKLPKGYNLFDGELRHNKVVGVQDRIVLFDVFIWDGEMLLDKTFQERREILKSHFVEAMWDQDLKTQRLEITEHFYGNFDVVYNNVIEHPEIEGLVMKKLNSRFNLSRTSNIPSGWMMKVRKETGRHRF